MKVAGRNTIESLVASIQMLSVTIVTNITLKNRIDFSKKKKTFLLFSMEFILCLFYSIKHTVFESKTNYFVIKK